ncbi:MAG TPA: 50S ribosomal protein L29 [Patescibacteria group bacterium]|nr:50S ribosomal protein L29 [Patescibacteria group bacterium]
MKKQDRELLINKTKPELNKEIKLMKEKLSQARLDLAAGKLKKTSTLGLLKYQIALIKTKL